MRSEANLRRSECQPRPRLGLIPASLSAFSHQPRLTHRLRHAGDPSTRAASARPRLRGASLALPPEPRSPRRSPAWCVLSRSSRAPPADLPGYPEQRPVLLVGEHDPGGVLLLVFLRPFSGFLSSSGRPCASLDLVAQWRTVIRNIRSCSMVRLATGLPLSPTLPDLRAKMKRSQSRWGERLGPAVPSEAARQHLHRGSVLQPRPLTLGGYHLFPVDFKKPFQGERGERLRLGVRLPVGRVDEACGELVGLPLRARGSGPAQAAAAATHRMDELIKRWPNADCRGLRRGIGGTRI